MKSILAISAPFIAGVLLQPLFHTLVSFSNRDLDFHGIAFPSPRRESTLDTDRLTQDLVLLRRNCPVESTNPIHVEWAYVLVLVIGLRHGLLNSSLLVTGGGEIRERHIFLLLRQ